jgi:hypothetical protein
MPRDDAPRTPTVSDDDGDAAQREVAGERQAGEPGAGNDDRIAPALARAEVGRRDERPARQLVSRCELPDFVGTHGSRYSASAKAAISSATRICRSARPAR